MHLRLKSLVLNSRRGIQLIGLVVLSFMMLEAPRLQTNSVSVWMVMRNEFKLDHHLERVEVQQQIRWLMAHPGYLSKLSEAKPYLYHIVTEIKKRNLPGEIALIPMVESAYDPFAYSGAGAAGIWQIMPHTGKDLGLKKDWWSDHRRSITPSTNAALNYLAYLHHFFNANWDLAIAAYDSGQGTVARAIKNTQQKSSFIDFWSLPLPRETQLYLPRLLALAEIVAYPERYHFRLPRIPHTPYFEEIKVEHPIDLNRAAKLAGMSYEELIKLNPGFNRWSPAPSQSLKLLIPTQKVDRFYQNLALDSKASTILSHYHVHHKETLEDIARRFDTNVQQLRLINQLEGNTIKNGQIILIPTVSKASKLGFSDTATGFSAQLPRYMKVIHIVQPKETIEQIAQKYKVSLVQIKQWNHLTTLKLGAKQELVIWKG